MRTGKLSRLCLLFFVIGYLPFGCVTPSPSPNEELESAYKKYSLKKLGKFTYVAGFQHHKASRFSSQECTEIHKGRDFTEPYHLTQKNRIEQAAKILIERIQRRVGFGVDKGDVFTDSEWEKYPEITSENWQEIEQRRKSYTHVRLSFDKQEKCADLPVEPPDDAPEPSNWVISGVCYYFDIIVYDCRESRRNENK